MIFNIVLEQLEKQKKVKREPWFTYFTYYKNELELNLNVKPIKHLEDLCNLGLAKDFLDITPNIWPIKEKNYKFDLNKTNNSILKNISKIWTDNSAMYRWQINMWKDTQYHLKWAKCKLKHNNLSLYLLDKLKKQMKKLTNKKSDNTKYWWGCWATGIIIHCWWGCKVVQPLCKTARHFLIDINLSYGLAISFLGIYPSEMKTCDHTNTCMWMFIAALFIFAPN